ncbi:MAG: Lrp/AsnC family transcriptional regulator, partial [Acidimicrobiales bacterium]|nr:Lrp/AsnC family transcriptional regulator [Acidimicrobiales bacterium]
MASVTVDDLDRKILHALYIDGRAPFNRLATVLGTSEQTVARRYRRLNQSGALRVVAQLDRARLGQSDWALRIRCPPNTTMPLAKALATRRDVSWVQLTSGGTEIFCTVRGGDERRRTDLLLDQLPSSGRI